MDRKSRKWRFVEGKESVFVYGGLGIAFILMLMLVIVLSSSLLNQEYLRMQSEAERAFNSVFIQLQDNPSQARITMVEENISGVAVYTTQGRLALGLGRVPNILPLNQFNAQRQKQKDTHSGIALYDHQAGIIEYIRFSRMTIMLDTGTLRVNDGVLAPAPVDFPDILYIRFNGRQHYDRVAAIQLLSIVSLAGVVFFFGLVYSIYRANRRYRVRLEQQERLVSLGEAARTLTHEIKNPLSAMTIQLALLRKTLPLENHADLEVVDNEIKRLNHLTNKVSDFLRNPVGEPQVIELRSFIENLSKLFAEPIMLSASGDERFEVQFDPERARSVFENLLKNAVESSAQGTPHVEVFLTKEKKRFIRIEIMDRGDGIPEKNLKSVFDPFFTTKIHGSGIGLSISRQFISAEGGSIRLLSREGGGTCVEVILPAYRHVRPHSRKENKDTL